jgi:hypothetical protein
MPNVDKMDFVERSMQVVKEPSKFFKAKFTEDLKTPAIHIILAAVIGALISVFFIVLPAQMLAGESIISAIIGAIFGAVITIIITPIIVLIAWPIGSLINHLFVLLVGGKGGWKRTLKITAYVGTLSIIGPIPIVGLLAALYSFYLTYVGYQKQHNLSKGRAAIAIILPIVVTVCIMFVMALVIGATLVTLIEAAGGI